jgi:hydrogenase/urease accessory protein HupE
MEIIFRTVVILFLGFTYLVAHSFQPAYLGITAQSDTHYFIEWKVPLHEEKELDIQLQFPRDCKELKHYKLSQKGKSVYYFSMECQKSLSGRTIVFENMKKGFTDVLVHVHSQKEYLQRVKPSSALFVFDFEKNFLILIWDYTLLGVQHILLGFDHLLFVLGLLLLIQRKKELLFTITAFTVAHSITLGLNSLGYVHLNSSFIELCIALSIVILSIEIIHSYAGRKGLSSKFPWTVAFLFGLIHGFGFASVLQELGLPSEHLLLALGFFNIGIEFGQLAFISLLLIVYLNLKNYLPLFLWHKGKLFIAYLIGIIATYWLVERMMPLDYSCV